MKKLGRFVLTIIVICLVYSLLDSFPLTWTKVEPTATALAARTATAKPTKATAGVTRLPTLKPATAQPVKTIPPTATPDPYAYSCRDWRSCMGIPTAQQLAAARGTSRSPYIAIYYHFPKVSRFLECSVDLHVDHQPLGTYVCPMNWWMDVSSLQARYASVYNDYTGTPGGYCGFQTLGDGSRVFIMTVWSTFCQDRKGTVTVFDPQVIYPEGKGKANVGLGEGTFVQCILPYDWHAGRDYRILLQHEVSKTTGNVVLTSWVCDMVKNEWAKLVSFDVGVPDVYMSSLGGFLEDFLTEYAGELRSLQLSNIRVRSANTYQWVWADSAKFTINGSVSDLNYSGSCNFGTDGASLWAITSGVSGLHTAPSDSVSYRLSSGAGGDPY